MTLYRFEAFKTKEEAQEFKRKRGYGVLYDLEKERRKLEKGKIPDSVAVIQGIGHNYGFSVEWNEVFT